MAVTEALEGREDKAMRPPEETAPREEAKLLKMAVKLETRV